MSIPVTPEDFANPQLRESWRKEKNMLVLRLWSDVHRGHPLMCSFMNHSILEKNLPGRNGNR